MRIASTSSMHRHFQRLATVVLLGGGLLLACGGSTTGVSDGGTSGSSGTSGGSSGTSGTPPVRFPQQHRPTAVTCGNPKPEAEPMVPDAGQNACSKHEDCTQGSNGRCRGSRIGFQCQYDQCKVDGDCQGGVCACDDGALSHCASSGQCHVDSDCGAGGACSPSFGSCGAYGGVTGYWCHGSSDECTDDADCGGQGAACAFDPAKNHWACLLSGCAG
jgi:hypothetical protein